MQNILILAAHPDDEIVGLSVFIKKKNKLGCNIFILFLTNGLISKDSRWFWDKGLHDKYLKERMSELLKSMKYHSIKKFQVQDIPSRTIKENINQSYKKVLITIKENNIDTIFTPAYEGGHQDHDVINYISSNFLEKYNVYEYAEYNFHGKKIRSNTFFDLIGNEILIKLNSEEKLFKKRAMKIYDSEKKNLSYIKLNQESYRPLRNYDYSLPPHKGVLFYRRFSFFSWHPRVDSTKPQNVCDMIQKNRSFVQKI